MGYRAGHDAQIAGATRAAVVARLTEGWSPAHRGFRRLQKAHATFFGAHGSSETDISGTAPAASGIGGQEKARTEFLDIFDVRRAAACRTLPLRSSADREADRNRRGS